MIFRNLLRGAMRVSLLTGLMTLTGCLFTVDSDRYSDDAGWTGQQLGRIEPGETTAAWIATTFGEPQRRTQYGDGSEVWHYTSSEKVDTEVGLFLLFHIDVESEERRNLSVELKDGVVMDYWVESSRH